MRSVSPGADFVFFIAMNNMKNFDLGTETNILTLQEAEQNSIVLHLYRFLYLLPIKIKEKSSSR